MEILTKVKQASLNSQARHHEAMFPADDDEIIKTLLAMSEMFQVELPETLGIDMYLKALRLIPRVAFFGAANALVQTHKWPRLPFPADFNNEAAKHIREIDNDAELIEIIYRKTNQAIALLHERS